MLIDEEDKGTHIKYMYMIYLPKLPLLKERGDEGELVSTFSFNDLCEMSTELVGIDHYGLLGSHAEIIKPYLNMLLGARDSA